MQYQMPAGCNNYYEVRYLLNYHPICTTIKETVLSRVLKFQATSAINFNRTGANKTAAIITYTQLHIRFCIAQSVRCGDCACIAIVIRDQLVPDLDSLWYAHNVLPHTHHVQWIHVLPNTYNVMQTCKTKRACVHVPREYKNLICLVQSGSISVCIVPKPLKCIVNVFLVFQWIIIIIITYMQATIAKFNMKE